jgi:uncharacterized Fe-S cluster protein YjdI/predicted GNAT family acetyltransferase
MTIRDYPTEGLTVHWNARICQHSGICAGTLPRVFRPSERPWIDPDAASASQLAAMIDTCPSGALSYTWTSTDEAEAAQVEAPLVEVVNAPERERYEILVDGAVAGFTHYMPHEGCLVFDHTLIKESYSGRGLASVLVRGALDDVRVSGSRIVPLCEYMAGWLPKHPDYEDLVDRDLLMRILATA